MYVERSAKIVRLIDGVYVGPAFLRLKKHQLHSLPISAKFCNDNYQSVPAVLIFEAKLASTEILGGCFKPSESHYRGSLVEILKTEAKMRVGRHNIKYTTKFWLELVVALRIKLRLDYNRQILLKSQNHL